MDNNDNYFLEDLLPWSTMLSGNKRPTKKQRTEKFAHLLYRYGPWSIYFSSYIYQLQFQ